MERKKQPDEGVIRHRPISSVIRSASVSAARAFADYAAQSQEQNETSAAASTALSYLFMRDDGWLRAVPSTDGKQLYIRWKFIRGQWAGFYVMSVVLLHQWEKGILLLADKCEEVDLGLRRPTRDKPYDGYDVLH